MSRSLIANGPPTFNRRQRLLTLCAALLGWGLDGVEMGVFPVVARPALVDMLGAGDELLVRRWNAGLSISFLLGAALGGVLFGRLGDRIGRVRALALSVLVYAGLTGVAALTQSPWQLALARFLAATGMGGEWALGVALVVETWPDRARPWLAGMIGAAVNVGYVAVALVAGYLDPTRWRLILGCCAAPAVLTCAFRWWVPESPAWLESRRHQKETSTADLFRGSLGRSTGIAALAVGVYLLAVWGAVQFTQLWAASFHSGSSATVQLVSAACAAVGAMIAPPLLARINRRIAYGGLCMAALLTSQGLFLTTDPVQRNFYWFVAATGLCTGALGGWFAMYLPELFPTPLRATGQGFCYNVGRILAAGGVALTAGMSGNYPQIAAIASGVYVIGILLAMRLPVTRLGNSA